jgi:hypothetical protein
MKGGCLMKAPHRNRNNIIYIRLSNREYTSFETQRNKTGLNKTDFLVQLIQKRTIKVFNIQPELQSIIYELKKQGVNLNQIAHSLNQDPFISAHINLTNIQEKYEIISNQILDFFNKVTTL